MSISVQSAQNRGLGLGWGQGWGWGCPPVIASVFKILKINLPKSSLLPSDVKQLTIFLQL